MDTMTARRILELPDNYTDVLLKKKYKCLAMKYHPDKNKENTNEKFTEINSAYNFLLNEKPEKVENVLNNIFKTFTSSFTFAQKPQPKNENINLVLTAMEYFLGCTKTVNIKQRCNCIKMICGGCGGNGFGFNGVCMECLGDCFTQKCSNCTDGITRKDINLLIAPCITEMEIFHNLTGIIKITLEEPYFVKENKLFCKFDIFLKESLTGFNKIFKDPFGFDHTICVRNIVKTNDGYQLTGINLVLVFNVVYPKTLDPCVIEQLNLIDF
jgi:hypothetical protein